MKINQILIIVPPGKFELTILHIKQKIYIVLKIFVSAFIFGLKYVFTHSILNGIYLFIYISYL